ncbi:MULTISPECIES: hypothetical protein [unclassified Microcoleus]|uniref:hypothetical protein n=1 Tax=unclassified Microcoleus TaxID=2642155 RepID=UPI0025F5523D|nr:MULTISPECIES: hypothetical protein [unclassified Microcoleus]
MQIKPAQVNIIKLSTSYVDIFQFNPAQISVLQNDVLKTSLTSSIAPEQFFYSYSFFFHNSTPVSIYTINNSTFFNALYPDRITHATAWRNPDTWRVTLLELTGILNKRNLDGDYNFNFDFLSNLP